MHVELTKALNGGTLMVTRHRLGRKGFTLMEVIVVLAVIAALTAVLVPVVFRYIDDGRKAQAQSDTNTIAAAIQQMYKDTGRWPFYNAGAAAGTLKRTAGTDADFLTSATAGAPTLAATSNVPDTTGSTGWGTSGNSVTKTLAAQLIENAPAYTQSGGRAWKGPYLDKIPPVDPWGKSYVVNIGNADPADETGTQKWTIVLSAGPNGQIETNGTTAGTSNPQVGGDDIVARVK